MRTLFVLLFCCLNVGFRLWMDFAVGVWILWSLRFLCCFVAAFGVLVFVFDLSCFVLRFCDFLLMCWFWCLICSVCLI